MTYIEIYNLLHDKSFDENTKVTDKSDREKVQKMIDFRDSKRYDFLIDESSVHCSIHTCSDLYDWCLKQDLIKI